MENQSFDYFAKAREKMKELIRRSEMELSQLNATRADLVAYMREYPMIRRWRGYQQGYISRKTDINKQPVEINKKTGICFVSLPSYKSTRYSIRDYFDVRCDDFVKWLTKKRKEDK